MRLTLLILFCCLVFCASAQKYVVDPVDTTEIFWLSTDRGPRFDGDIFNYLNQHTVFPGNLHGDVMGKLIISFIVERDGSLTEFKINRSVNPLIDTAVLLAVKQSKWLAAKRETYHVRVMLSLHMDVVARQRRQKITLSRHRYTDSVRDETDKELLKTIGSGYPFVTDLFYDYLAKNMIYPAEALKEQRGYDVYWAFNIDDQGKVTEILSRGVTPEPFKSVCLKAARRYRFEQYFKPAKLRQFGFWIIFDPKRPHNFEVIASNP